jgi:L-alanine-DL-glutamate epimerase-like enolase superfamily enzyme
MKLTLHRFDLRLKHPFTIARGTTVLQPVVVVELEQDGVRGYGETPETPFYHATVSNILDAVERVRNQIESTVLGDPVALWESLSPNLSHARYALCAIDIAAHDLWGKLHGKPVWELWGLDLRRCPLTDVTIGIDTIDVMVQKLHEFPGWPIYKIKLGTPHDLAIIEALRQHTQAVFRVDANCAWDTDETIRNAAAMQPLGVEFIEQPMQPDRWDDMRRVLRESPLPLIADESCQTEEDIEHCAECFHGINVKLIKCGGLTPARRMIAKAKRHGLKTMVGCMTESTVSTSAIAQLLPLLDYVDMDGTLLLADDVASGVRIEAGRVVYPQENGCGVRLNRSHLLDRHSA